MLKKSSLLILLLVFSALPYLDSLHNSFVDFDDPALLFQNSLVTHFDLKKVFTTINAEDYLPFATISFATEYSFFGFNPFNYHLTNLIFHLLNVGLVFVFINLILPENIFIACVSALLFGIHPLHVESVAWVSQRKDMLCTFFSLLSLIFYYKTIRTSYKNKFVYLLISLLFFLFALFSKFMAITLPGLLILISLYKKEKRKKALIKGIPFVGLMIIFAYIHLRLHNSTTQIVDENFSLIVGIKNAFNSLAFYMSKSFYPDILVAFYEKNVVFVTWSEYLVLALYVLATGLFIKIAKSYRRAIIFFNLFFIISIFPVLQIIPSGNKFIFGDRFMYLPSIGIFSVVAIFVNEFIKVRFLKIPTLLGIILATAFLSYKSHTQTFTWMNSTELWKNVLRYYPQSSVANNNLGVELRKKGKSSEAIEFFNKAIQLDSNYSAPHSNLIDAYTGLNQLAQAHQELEASKQLGINDRLFYFNAGVLSEKENNLPVALDYYKKSIQLDPSFASSYVNLSSAYYRMDQKDEAIKTLLLLFEFNTQIPEAFNNLGVMYSEQNKTNEAILLLNKAILLNSNYSEPHKSLATIYFKIGKNELATSELNKFIKIEERSKNILSK